MHAVKMLEQMKNKKHVTLLTRSFNLSQLNGLHTYLPKPSMPLSLELIRAYRVAALVSDQNTVAVLMAVRKLYITSKMDFRNDHVSLQDVLKVSSSVIPFQIYREDTQALLGVWRVCTQPDHLVPKTLMRLEKYILCTSPVEEIQKEMSVRQSCTPIQNIAIESVQ